MHHSCHHVPASAEEQNVLGFVVIPPHAIAIVLCKTYGIHTREKGLFRYKRLYIWKVKNNFIIKNLLICNNVLINILNSIESSRMKLAGRVAHMEGM